MNATTRVTATIVINGRSFLGDGDHLINEQIVTVVARVKIPAAGALPASGFHQSGDDSTLPRYERVNATRIDLLGMRLNGDIAGGNYLNRCSPAITGHGQ